MPVAIEGEDEPFLVAWLALQSNPRPAVTEWRTDSLRLLVLEGMSGPLR